MIPAMLLNFYGDETAPRLQSTAAQKAIQKMFIDSLKKTRPDIYNRLSQGAALSGEQTEFLGNWFTQAGRWFDKSITQPIIKKVSQPINYVGGKIGDVGKWIDTKFTEPIVVPAAQQVLGTKLGLTQPGTSSDFLGIPIMYWAIGGGVLILLLAVSGKKSGGGNAGFIPYYPPPYQPQYQPAPHR